jgi:hypothetical protein
MYLCRGQREFHGVVERIKTDPILESPGQRLFQPQQTPAFLLQRIKLEYALIQSARVRY